MMKFLRFNVDVLPNSDPPCILLYILTPTTNKIKIPEKVPIKPANTRPAVGSVGASETGVVGVVVVVVTGTAGEKENAAVL